ncbi:hypothetical protein BDW72DRAFT_167864 [Aspergillus terricola var. indicus]
MYVYLVMVVQMVVMRCDGCVVDVGSVTGVVQQLQPFTSHSLAFSVMVCRLDVEKDVCMYLSSLIGSVGAC